MKGNTMTTYQKLIASTLLVVGISLSTMNASASTPSDASVQKLAELTPYEDVFFDNIIAPIVDERNALLYGLMNDSTLTDDQRQKAMQAFDAYVDNLIKVLDTPETKAELKTAYVRTAKAQYTQAEVDAQIAFYGSDAGKSALQKRNGVLSGYLETVMPTNIAKVEAYQTTHLTPMQDTIKRILNK